MFNKFLNILISIYQYIVVGLFFAINLYLLFISIFKTSTITLDGYEYTTYNNDLFIVHFIVAALIIVLMVVIKKTTFAKRIVETINSSDKCFERIKWILLGIAAITGFSWVLLTQTSAGADQYYCMEAAYGLRVKDFSAFAYDGYASKYQNQLGLIMIEYLLGFIVGDFNYIFFQLLNVFMVVMTYKLFSDILGLFNFSNVVRLSAILLCVLFYPWTMYSVFVYGNVPGLFFAMLAFKHAYLFIRKMKGKKYIHHAVICGVCIMLSLMVKNNYLIFMIALLIYIFAEFLRKKDTSLIVLMCSVIIGTCLQGLIPTVFIESITKSKLGDGASSYAWIDMGLRSNGDSKSYADGWYNYRISRLYEDCGYSKEEEAKVAKKEIKEKLDAFMNDKAAFRTFLSNKIASQWNNPTFQCYWITVVRHSNVTMPGFISDSLTMKGNKPYAAYLNILQTIILLGSLMYCILFGFRRKFLSATLLPLTFIGGFIFHLFWEGKCQYTLPFFMLLIPLCVIGLYGFYKVLKVK